MSRSEIVEALEKGLEYKTKYDALVEYKAKYDAIAEKHRHMKQRMLMFLEVSGNGNYTKQNIRDEMFKIYQELK